MATDRDHLGCGESPCGACEAKRRAGLGAVLSFDPIAAAGAVAPMFGIPPDFAKSAASTAIGLTTPVSAEDAAAFAHLTELSAQLQAAAFGKQNSPAQRAQLQALLADYSRFARSWNAAQRDPEKLRALIGQIEGALASLQPAAGAPPGIHFPKPYRRQGWVRRHAVPLAVGGTLVVLGTAIAVVR